MASPVLLVPYDFSGPSAHALEEAIKLAIDMGGRIVLVHAYELPVVGYASAPLVAAELGPKIEETARRSIEHVVAQRKSPGCPIEVVLRPGDAATVITDLAVEREVRFIVMGTHGRTGLAHLFLGSVTESVLHSALCPVITVRGNQSEEPRQRSAPKTASVKV